MTANFALVQPSVQADVPKVLKEVVAIVGGQVPSLRELSGGRAMQRTARGGAESELDLRSLLRPVIQKNATVEQVDAAAKKAEEYFAKHPRAALEAGTIARRIIDADKLENYGTERCKNTCVSGPKHTRPNHDRNGSARKAAPTRRKTVAEAA